VNEKAENKEKEKRCCGNCHFQEKARLRFYVLCALHQEIFWISSYCEQWKPLYEDDEYYNNLEKPCPLDMGWVVEQMEDEDFDDFDDDLDF